VLTLALVETCPAGVLAVVEVETGGVDEVFTGDVAEVVEV
jgi:hypothetical protein